MSLVSRAPVTSLESRKVKILVLSKDAKEGVANSENIVDLINAQKLTHVRSRLGGLINQLNLDRIDYQIEFASEITSEKMVADSQKIAQKINDGNYNIVLMGEDINLSPWEIIRHCSKLKSEQKSEKKSTAEKPMFYIDGNISDILDREIKQSNFCGVIGIVKDGKPLLKTTPQGKANRKANLDNTPETRFNIASITKMFTSLAIAQLIREKKLEYDKPVRDSLSVLDIPDVYKRIFQNFDFTPRELLTHTAGLDDRMAKMFELDLGPKMLEFKSVMKFVENYAPLSEQKLGTRGSVRYSNLGYDLLGLIIEAIKGDYYRYIQENIFDPAGMTHTMPCRNSGVPFSIPHVKIDLDPIPDASWLKALKSTEDKSNLKLRELAIKADKWLDYVNSTQEVALQIKLLFEDYQKELAFVDVASFPAFKEKFAKRLQEVYGAMSGQNEVKNEIERIGYALHVEVDEMKGDEPAFATLNKLDELLYNLFNYLKQQTDAVSGLLNNLSMASPCGRNYQSTVDDMLAFDRALKKGGY